MCARFAAWQCQRSQLQASQVTVAGVSCNRAASPKAHGGMRGRVTGEWQSCYVSFHECVRTSKIYVRDCTPVPPLAMLLFCKSTYRPRLVPPAQNVCRHACASCAFLSRLAVMSAVPTFAGRPCLPPSCFGSSLLASTLSSFDPSLLDPHRGAAAYGGMAWLTCRWR